MPRAWYAIPVPATLVDAAAIPGLSHARFWGDEAPNDIIAFVQTHMPAAKRMAVSRSVLGERPVVEYLALSSGAGDGAFGAGLLAGWTKRGDRPKFEVVTGVSAGALSRRSRSWGRNTTRSCARSGASTTLRIWPRRKFWPACSAPSRLPTPRRCAS